MENLIKHKRLSIALCFAWLAIAAVIDFIMLGYFSVPIVFAHKILAYLMMFIAILFVVVYEYVLLPVGKDRRDFSKH